VPGPSLSVAWGGVTLAIAGIVIGCSTSPSLTSTPEAGRIQTTVVPNDTGVPFDTGTDASPLQTNVRLGLFAASPFGVDIGLRAATATVYPPSPLLYSQLPSLPDGGADDAGVEAGPRDGGRDGGPRDASPDSRGAAADGSDGASDARADATLAGDATTDADLGDARPDSSSTGPIHLTGGVLPGQLSGYLTVPGAGTFDIAIVKGGTGSCTQPIAVHAATLGPGKFATLMVVSLPSADAAASGPSLVVLTDEPAELPAMARARFVNVTTPVGDAGALPLSVVALSQGQPTPLALDVAPDHEATTNPAAPAVDTLGYWAGSALQNPVELRIGPAGEDSGAAWASTPESLDLSVGSNHTGFIWGGGALPRSLLWCNDEESHSVLTSCTPVGGS